MEKPTGSTTDLIAAAVVTAGMGRQKRAVEAAERPAECTDLPFPLIAFAIALSQADASRQGIETTKKS